MEHNFARLLRSSKFASHDPKLKQVWTTYGSARKSGDWGMKRNMPEVIKFKYITVQDVDNKWRYTHWLNGAQQVYGVEKFLEMFGGTKPPVVTGEGGAKPKTAPVEINRLTEREWKAFISKMKAKRDEWQALKNSQLKSGVADALVFADAVAPQVEAGRSFASAKIPAKVSDERKPVGITYSHQEPKPVRTVQGRILNRNGPEYVVGVAGFAGKLQGSVTMSYADPSVLSRSLQEFYVVSADINEKGQPEILLSKNRPLVGTFMKQWRGMGPAGGAVWKNVSSSPFSEKRPLATPEPKGQNPN